ncbi:hypothetical protein N3K66_008095 [Trichothecium roseum]|uniref:Uncharacterized protein n=1 Tax=Trichothecium roseum TaxID=47278 RepID=A0ACC0USK0_9HYPO|nr:hypothetical protein N3K66_008095 [Trichothecium roseum]
MSSQTPRSGDKRSNSRSRTSRPTTPLRPSSRSSFRDSARGAGGTDASFPLNAFEPAFAELSDAMADLEANMMHFQLMHESLSRFTESFSSFLYGLNMNAFCVDFPEGPIPESFRRDLDEEPASVPSTRSDAPDTEATFMTTDTSFVDNPPVSAKPGTKKANPETRQSRLPAARGAPTRGRTTSTRSRGRGSALPRGRGTAR